MVYGNRGFYLAQRISPCLGSFGGYIFRIGKVVVALFLETVRITGRPPSSTPSREFILAAEEKSPSRVSSLLPADKLLGGFSRSFAELGEGKLGHTQNLGAPRPKGIRGKGKDRTGENQPVAFHRKESVHCGFLSLIGIHAIRRQACPGTGE